MEIMKYSVLAKLTKENLLTVSHNYNIVDVFKAGCWEYNDLYKRNLLKVLPCLPIFKNLTIDEMHKIIFSF